MDSSKDLLLKCMVATILADYYQQAGQKTSSTAVELPTEETPVLYNTLSLELTFDDGEVRQDFYFK